MVPHLRTALTGPLAELEVKMLGATPMIERWFRMEWQEHTPPFYSSVDVRNAGFKLAPVDTNLFPGGFNNLAEEMFPLATQAAMAAIWRPTSSFTSSSKAVPMAPQPIRAICMGCVLIGLPWWPGSGQACSRVGPRMRS